MMSDGDVIVFGLLALAIVVTPTLIVAMWMNLRWHLRRIKRIAGDPRKEFD